MPRLSVRWRLTLLLGSIIQIPVSQSIRGRALLVSSKVLQARDVSSGRRLLTKTSGKQNSALDRYMSNNKVLFDKKNIMEEFGKRGMAKFQFIESDHTDLYTAKRDRDIAWRDAMEEPKIVEQGVDSMSFLSDDTEYVQLSSQLGSTCFSDGLQYITEPPMCASAARYLNVTFSNVSTASRQDRPYGCYAIPAVREGEGTALEVNENLLAKHNGFNGVHAILCRHVLSTTGSSRGGFNSTDMLEKLRGFAQEASQ
ncbi:hypothetical protein CYMTET_25857, partial [Cymbomonas tetramitiformis]